MSDIVKRLEIKAGVMEMGERIAWGSDTALMREAAHQITTLTAEVARLTGELEKETAHSKHLAGAVSRKIEELIATENQCGYYRTQYSRAEQVRKEACEANAKAQAAMLWLEADLERSRQECEGLREAVASLIGATRHLNPCPGTMEQALAALSASGREVNDAPAE